MKEKLQLISQTEDQRNSYEQLYNKMNNLKEKGKFLETYSLLRLDHEQTENLNRSIVHEVWQKTITIL